MKRFFYTSIFAIFLFGVSHLQSASDVLKFLDSHGGIDNSEGKPQAYKILPIPYKEQLSVYSGEQLKCYNEDQLNYIAGMVDRLKTTFSKEDLLICPGRSCIHFSNILKAHGYCVTSPSFSKGHIVLNAVRGSEYDNKEEKSAKQIELQEELRGFPKGYLDTKANLSGFLSKFEDLPAYVDFDAKEVKPAETLLVSRKQIEGYRKYLAEKCGISPDGMKNIKGSIVLFDSVCTGGGIAGFLKIILDWCNEEKLDISARVKIVNFNYRMREIPVFDAGNPLADYWSSMSYTLVPEHIWRDFSYNHIQTASNEHFFFPPWAWEQKQLWEFLPNQ